MYVYMRDHAPRYVAVHACGVYMVAGMHAVPRLLASYKAPVEAAVPVRGASAALASLASLATLAVEHTVAHCCHHAQHGHAYNAGMLCTASILCVLACRLHLGHGGPNAWKLWHGYTHRQGMERAA